MLKCTPLSYIHSGTLTSPAAALLQCSHSAVLSEPKSRTLLNADLDKRQRFHVVVFSQQHARPGFANTRMISAAWVHLTGCTVSSWLPINCFLQFQWDDWPVLGLLKVTVPVKGQLHGGLHGLNLGCVLAIEFLHLSAAPLAGTLVRRHRAASPGDAAQVPVGRDVAFMLLGLYLLLLFCEVGQTEKRVIVTEPS